MEMKTRRYGDNNTIHDTNHIDISLDEKGNVVAIWFRCQMLPFVVSKFPTNPKGYPSNKYLPKIQAIILQDES